MQFRELELGGAYEITLEPVFDVRGYFTRTYAEEYFAERGLTTNWVHENQSCSMEAHTIRGLHFQRPPKTETKLIRVSQGAILDVIVDLRLGSPTYGRWCSIELSPRKFNMLYVPKAFAHGFCTLDRECVVQYKVDEVYDPANEGGLVWNDPALGIDWPTNEPLVSARDSNLPSFDGFESPFRH